MNKIENHDYPNPAQSLMPPTKSFSRPIRKILRKALAKSPKDRYRSCKEFREDLTKLTETEFPWPVLYTLGAIIGIAIGIVIFEYIGK